MGWRRLLWGVHGKENNFHFSTPLHWIIICLGKVWINNKTSSLSSLWKIALLQVLSQGDAHHEVQPQQACPCLRCLFWPSDTRSRSWWKPFLILPGAITNIILRINGNLWYSANSQGWKALSTCFAHPFFDNLYL